MEVDLKLKADMEKMLADAETAPIDEERLNGLLKRFVPNYVMNCWGCGYGFEWGTEVCPECGRKLFRIHVPAWAMLPKMEGVRPPMPLTKEQIQELRDDGMDEFTIEAMMHFGAGDPRKNEVFKYCIGVAPIDKPDGTTFERKPVKYQ